MKSYISRKFPNETRTTGPILNGSFRASFYESRCGTFVGQREEQYHRRPAGTGLGCELTPAMRKSAFEGVRLYGNCQSRYEPRAVGELIPQQPLHALLVDGIFDGDVSGDVQGIERLAGGIRFARHSGNLAPASIRVLNG